MSKHYVARNQSEWVTAGVKEIDFNQGDGDCSHGPVEVIEKEWGHEKIILNGRNTYCLKEMYLKPGYQVSLHWHRHKEETFILITGELVIETANTQKGTKETTILTEQLSSFTLEPGVPHTFYSNNDKSVVFLEASTYDEEHDSYRLFPSGPKGSNNW
jgi:mannose-6-phosphate isomerase-like protein (cupin superfamily)